MVDKYIDGQIYGNVGTGTFFRRTFFRQTLFRRTLFRRTLFRRDTFSTGHYFEGTFSRQDSDFLA